MGDTKPLKSCELFIILLNSKYRYKGCSHSSGFSLSVGSCILMADFLDGHDIGQMYA